jgi:hypothetical protein
MWSCLSGILGDRQKGGCCILFLGGRIVGDYLSTGYNSRTDLTDLRTDWLNNWVTDFVVYTTDWLKDWVTDLISLLPANEATTYKINGHLINRGISNFAD